MSEMEMENICFICMDIMTDSDKCILDCNHEFHIECIKFTILSKTNKNSYLYNETKKECPYCRNPICIRKLEPNETPVIGLHYTNENCCKELIISGKNKDKLCNTKIYSNSSCSYHLNNKQCQAIYKSGKNKGKQCTVLTKNIHNDIILCGRHSKKAKTSISL